MGLRIFPVAGGARYTDDWNQGDRPFRVHLGNDLFAPEGTPLLAVDDGVVRFGTDPLGGNVANLRAPDGTRYYYAHLTGFRGESNRRVGAGEIIGYLGTTGNAAGTPPHTHFEVHPGGGEAVNPFPFLQRAVVSKGDSAARSLLWPVALAGAAGIAAWALTEPAAARSFWRKVIA